MDGANCHTLNGNTTTSAKYRVNIFDIVSLLKLELRTHLFKLINDTYMSMFQQIAERVATSYSPVKTPSGAQYFFLSICEVFENAIYFFKKFFVYKRCSMTNYEQKKFVHPDIRRYPT